MKRGSWQEKILIISRYFENIKKMMKNTLKIYEDGDSVLWFLKDQKIKKGKFLFLWTGPF
jgi:hypothetical protein